MERTKLNTQIYEEACEWFIECRAGDLNEATRYEFDRWLRKSPEHLSAYLEIAAIWDGAPSLDPANKYNLDGLIADAARDRDNIVALTGASLSASTLTSYVKRRERLPAAPIASSGAAGAEELPHRAHAKFTRRLGLIAASLTALGLAIGGIGWMEQTRATFTTALGEQRSLELADGSTVSLNSRSKIRVSYSVHERNVELVAGQALFHVAKDATRPFVVMSGTTRVRAVGTEFDVYQKRDDTVVTVVEGRVAVLTNHPAISINDSAPSTALTSTTGIGEPVPANLQFPEIGAGGASNILVSAGEQLTVTPSRLQKSDHANVANATAWTMRRLVFESASLSEVAEEFNRYNGRQLIIVGPDLDSFHISGVFSSTDPASLIRFLRSRPGLHVVETDSEIRIEKNNP